MEFSYGLPLDQLSLFIRKHENMVALPGCKLVKPLGFTTSLKFLFCITNSLCALDKKSKQHP